MLSCFSCVRLFVTLWTVTFQAPLSMGFSRQVHWSELPCPTPEDLPNPGIKPTSPVAPALQADSLLLSHKGSPFILLYFHLSMTQVGEEGLYDQIKFYFLTELRYYRLLHFSLPYQEFLHRLGNVYDVVVDDGKSVLTPCKSDQKQGSVLNCCQLSLKYTPFSLSELYYQFSMAGKVQINIFKCFAFFILSNNHTICTIVYPDLPTEAFFHVYASTLPTFILVNESPLMTQALLKPLLWYLEQVFVCEHLNSRLSATSDPSSSVCVLVTQCV